MQTPAPMITQGVPSVPELNRRSFPRIQLHSKLLIWVDSKEQQRSNLFFDICGFYLTVVRSQLYPAGSYWNQMNRLYIIGVVLFAMMIRTTSAVVMFASTGSIQQEGNAMADIARAIPGLTTLSGMDWYVLRAYVCWMYDLSFLWCDAIRCDAIYAVIWYDLIQSGYIRYDWSVIWFDFSVFDLIWQDVI